MGMRKYRIVEVRVTKYNKDGTFTAVPRFYVEVGDRILFWHAWNRFLFGYDSKDEAMSFVKAKEEEDRFKSRLL